MSRLYNTQKDITTNFEILFIKILISRLDINLNLDIPK